MKVKDLFFIIIGLVLMCKFIFFAYKSNKTILHKPYTDKYPVLDFEQFKSLYAVAPEKWKWITRSSYETDYHYFEYTTKEKNPNYQTPEELKRIYYNRMYDNNFYGTWANQSAYKEVTKRFTYYLDEKAKIADFFYQKKKEKQEEKNAQEMLACLPFWKEDAENAAKRAQEEILKAQTNYEEILNRMKGNNNG